MKIGEAWCSQCEWTYATGLSAWEFLDKHRGRRGSCPGSRILVRPVLSESGRWIVTVA